MPASSKSKKAEPAAQEDLLLGPHVGRLVGVQDGAALVDFPENRRGPLVARSTLALSETQLQQSARRRQAVVLMFEKGDPGAPLLMGLIDEPSATPHIDAVLEQRSLDAVPTEARVDGQTVTLEGRQEVVLKCGKASITLRRNGQILLKGVNIRTEAEGTQQIKGGKVQIN